MNRYNLPLEVVAVIFSHIDDVDTLLALAQLCSAWYGEIIHHRLQRCLTHADDKFELWSCDDSDLGMFSALKMAIQHRESVYRREWDFMWESYILAPTNSVKPNLSPRLQQIRSSYYYDGQYRGLNDVMAERRPPREVLREEAADLLLHVMALQPLSHCWVCKATIEWNNPGRDWGFVHVPECILESYEYRAYDWLSSVQFNWYFGGGPRHSIQLQVNSAATLMSMLPQYCDFLESFATARYACSTRCLIQHQLRQK